MSTGHRIPAAQARAVADALTNEFAHYCDRWEIAGSLRRGAPDVGDIEVVAVPRLAPSEVQTLFGPVATPPRFELDDVLAEHLTRGAIQHAPHKGWGERQKKFMFDGVQIDLYITDAARFGVILLIRTGPQEFSHALAAWMQRGGDWRFAGGALEYRSGDAIGWLAHPTPEERDVFAALGLSYIEPAQRSLSALEQTING